LIEKNIESEIEVGSANVRFGRMAAMKITAAMAQMKSASIVLLLPPISPLGIMVFLSRILHI
jgi:hypothetical protein